MKKLIKADVNELTADALVAKAAYILEAMTGNANFPDPLPSLAVVNTAHGLLVQTIVDAKDFARPAIIAKNLAAKNLRNLLARLADYVSAAAMGDLVVALSSGFGERKTRAAVVLTRPDLLFARTSIQIASIDLQWRRLPGVRMYNVYMTEGTVDDDSIWKCVANTSRAKCTISRLRRSAYFSFQITAIGAAGEGPASAAGTAKAA